MIGIIGATGTIGEALLKRLVELDVPARALSREPEKLRARLGEKERSMIEVASADAAEPESLRQSLKGVSQLFMAMSNSPKQIELETSIIQIAVESGVEHLVKISSPAFEEKAPVAVAGWHQEIERNLSDSGLQYTVLRPYAFMQNLLRFAPTIAAQNVFFGSMGDSSCNFIDCRDIADVAAEVLTNRKSSGQIYTLTGSETFSYPQIASMLTDLLERPIRYINIPSQELYRNLIEQGQLPPWIANHVIEIQAMVTVIPERPTDTIRHLLNREPRTLAAFLHEHQEAFR
ncbi:SDR family oxidoreductase [Paenibacillus sp. J22TS3]|uniref:SDR family oxidoreductase n=1 Tax=Paenibacillus sp. J22TS3 TaxID=2807192 RepID=UPI001B2AE8DB|nr:SDR family oxidoreductase [Paenibacillus sp. J22TS3]GIP23238.1 nucleotide-diphosphate-sugar epimerase [Paenibacillus sp. J22TS3]